MPRSQFTKNFIKDLLTDKKRLLRQAEVNMITVPNFKELSVKSLWPEVANDEDISLYFDDDFPEGKYPARDYFFNVLNTIHPEFLRQVIDHANNMRHGAAGLREKAEVIDISEEWLQKLGEFPFKSR